MDGLECAEPNYLPEFSLYRSRRLLVNISYHAVSQTQSHSKVFVVGVWIFIRSGGWSILRYVIVIEHSALSSPFRRTQGEIHIRRIALHLNS